MNFRVRTEKLRRFFERLLPLLRREFEFGERPDGLHGRHLRKIIKWLLGAELAQERLLIRKRFVRNFVSAVRRVPELAAERYGIVVQRCKVYHSHAGAVVAVLFVITDANHYSNTAHMHALILPQRAKSRFRRILLHIREPIFDVVRR